jgi:hypothetical protein
MAASKSKKETVAYRWQRHHASLQTGHYLTVQSKRQDPVRVFFGQGDIDGACGVHVLSAVLVLMGLAKNSALQDMPRRKYGVPAEVWATFSHTFFCGVHAHEFVELADTLKLPLNLTLRQDKDGGQMDGGQLAAWGIGGCDIRQRQESTDKALGLVRRLRRHNERS